MGRTSACVGLVASVVLSGCFAPPDKVADLKCNTEVELEPVKSDILFIIDDSCSMTQKQEALAASLTDFVSELNASEIKQDFQVGIITTSIWQHTADDNGVPSRWPEESGHLIQATRADGSKTPKVLRPDSPTFLDDFKLAVRVGNQGSGQETHLEAALRAVGRVPGDAAGHPLIDLPQDKGGNQGFLRDGARLLMITLTDEDDCSERTDTPSVLIGADYKQDYCDSQKTKLASLTTYRDEFGKLLDSMGRPRSVSFAAIAPVAPSSREVARVDDVVIDPKGNQVPGFHNVDCPTSLGVGRRLKEFAAFYGSPGFNLDSICNASYKDTLLAFANYLEAANELELKVPPPDPQLMYVEITRANDKVDKCAVREGSPTDTTGYFTYEAPTADSLARVRLEGTCKRLPDDKKIAFKLVCAS